MSPSKKILKITEDGQEINAMLKIFKSWKWPARRIYLREDTSGVASDAIMELFIGHKRYQNLCPREDAMPALEKLGCL